MRKKFWPGVGKEAVLSDRIPLAKPLPEKYRNFLKNDIVTDTARNPVISEYLPERLYRKPLCNAVRLKYRGILLFFALSVTVFGIIFLLVIWGIFIFFAVTVPLPTPGFDSRARALDRSNERVEAGRWFEKTLLLRNSSESFVWKMSGFAKIYVFKIRKKLRPSKLKSLWISTLVNWKWFQDVYEGKNSLFSHMFNRSIQCAESSALKSMRISTDYQPAEGETEKCLNDSFPWPTRPLNERNAQQLLKTYFLTVHNSKTWYLWNIFSLFQTSPSTE